MFASCEIGEVEISEDEAYIGLGGGSGTVQFTLQYTRKHWAGSSDTELAE